MHGRNPPFASLLVAIALALSGCAGLGPLGAGYFDTVVIDAGHGGHAGGGRPVTGRYEKDLALDTSKRLQKALQRRGFRVVMTRNADYFVGLDQRVAVSHRSGRTIFVSVHYNWSKSRSARGVETFYYLPQASRLAANVQRELARAYGTPNRGVKHRGFYVLRKNKRPAILVEGGFVSNPSENALLQSPSGRQRIADAIARGISAEHAARKP